MRFSPNKNYFAIGITIFCVVAASIIFFLCLYNIQALFDILNLILKYLTPVIIGLAIAFILNPVLNFFEKKVFKKFFVKNPASKLARIFSIIACFVLMGLILSGVFLFILPQLISTVNSLISSIPSYLENLKNWVEQIFNNNSELAAFVSDYADKFIENFDKFIESIIPQLNKLLSTITSGAIGLVVSVTNIVVGIIISIYAMMERDRLKGQSIKIIFAISSKRFANYFLSVLKVTYDKFSKFISGKLIDSFIVGIICFIGMIIFNFPFALLISVIIAITNIIPFFGPFIGAIPCAMLVLFVNPISAFWFLIFILALQQFDGNILSPKILGDCIGISPFWVLSSILLGGGLFGVLGMIISIPLFSVIYSIVKVIIEKRLKFKNLPEDTDYYSNISENFL